MWELLERGVVEIRNERRGGVSLAVGGAAPQWWFEIVGGMVERTVPPGAEIGHKAGS